jgi:hypothetical protein
MSDAKVAYGFDGRGKVSPKTLPLPATRLKGIRQRKQATDGKIRK